MIGLKIKKKCALKGGLQSFLFLIQSTGIFDWQKVLTIQSRSVNLTGNFVELVKIVGTL